MSGLVIVTDPIDKKRKPELVGMRCPSCNNTKSATVDSRPAVFANNGTTARTRECTNCGEKWRTYEINPDMLSEIKRSMAKRLLEILLEDIE